MYKSFSIVLCLTAGLALAGCGNTTGQRALSGGGIGAASGAVLGAAAGFNPLIGAAVGGAGGAAIGAATTR